MITLYELKHTRICRCYHKQPFYVRNVFLMALLSLALTVIYFIYFSKEIRSVRQIPKLLQGLTSVTFNTLDEQADQLKATDPVVRFDAESSPITYKGFYNACVHYNKACFVQNFASEWDALSKWRFEEGQDYLQGKIKGKVTVFRNLEDEATMQEDYLAGIDNFKSSYIKDFEYETFLSKLQTNKFGVVMRDREVYKRLKDDIVLPEFLEKYSQRQFVDVIQGRQFTMASQYQRVDNFFCVIEGSVNFYLVHPIYRQEVYGDVQTDNLLRNSRNSDTTEVPFAPFEETRSPVNFANPNLDKYPKF